MSTTGEQSTGTIYEQIQASSEFAELRSKLRRFIFPMSAAFLIWYLLYVLLASYAPGFITTGILATTGRIVTWLPDISYAPALPIIGA